MSRPALRLPCEKPEPPRVVLERMPVHRTTRVGRGLEIVVVVLVSLFALSWLIRQFGR